MAIAYNEKTGLSYNPNDVAPAPKVPPVADSADVTAAKKMAADVAKSTGQQVDPTTGKIIIDQAAIAKKFPASSGGSTGGNTGGNTGNATQDLLAAQQAKADAEAKLRDRQSAYDILYNEFNKYGLGSLVEDIKGLIQSNVSPSQFSLELQNTDAYKKRFSANQDRIKAGLKATMDFLLHITLKMLLESKQVLTSFFLMMYQHLS